jgi:predicted ferric reductase/Ca2+-binding EF-hand superfamily protein
MNTGQPTATGKDLLARLERAFERHAGKDARIDATELQQALGLRSPYLARRVLAVFDRDGNGTIEREEFLQGVRQLVFGDVREKLWFAFRLHDHDGDGFIDPTEMLRMIWIGMAESEIAERATQPAEHLTRVLFHAADTNRDGRISFEEFVAAIQARPRLLRQMTQSEAIWIAPNEELLAWLETPGGAARRPFGRLPGEGWQGLIFLALWLLANASLLAFGLLRGLAPRNQDAVMQLGRALALCIDFNGALILVPMMRRLLTRLRSTWLGHVLPVDDAVSFHRIVGQTLFALALAHAACSMVAYANGHADAPLSHLVFGTLIGASGAALLLVFAVMWAFSLAFVRRTRHFELFYFTHLLYVAWFVLAAVHAPSFLIWASLPLAGFAVEQIRRVLHRAPSSRVTSSRALRSGVTRLEIERPAGFEFAPADYVFLRIPAVARHEWHPFTLSSAPERPGLTVHVRALGNWSKTLRRLVEDAPDAPLRAYVDGPYGSPSAHIFTSRVAVLIGAGIGVTPFASVLESLVLRANGSSDRPSRLEHAYFFWLNHDQYSFEWFSTLLSQLEGLDRRGLLEMHLCMTGARSSATALGLELARDVMHGSGRSDMITGLRMHTHVGRPDWEAMLGSIAERHGSGQVDVFYCGPAGLATRLSPLCRRLGMSFREEKF